MQNCWRLKRVSVVILFNASDDDNISLSEWREMSQKTFCRYTSYTNKNALIYAYIAALFFSVFHHDSQNQH